MKADMLEGTLEGTMEGQGSTAAETACRTTGVMARTACTSTSRKWDS